MNICWWHAYTHSQLVRTYTQRNTQLTYRPMVIWGGQNQSPRMVRMVLQDTLTHVSKYISTLFYTYIQRHIHIWDSNTMRTNVFGVISNILGDLLYLTVLSCMTVSFSHPPKWIYMENWFCVYVEFLLYQTFHFVFCFFLGFVLIYFLSLFILLLPLSKCNVYMCVLSI